MSEPYFSEEEKIKQGHVAFKAFFDDLGPNDIYKRILLETFFEFIYKNSENNSLLFNSNEDEEDFPLKQN